MILTMNRDKEPFVDVRHSQSCDIIEVVAHMRVTFKRKSFRTSLTDVFNSYRVYLARG